MSAIHEKSWVMLLSPKLKNNFFSLRRLQICPYCSSVIHLGTWGSRYVGSFKTNDFLQILTYTAIVCQYENKNSHTNWKRTHFHYMLCCKTNLFNSHQHKKNLSVSVIFKKIDELLLYVKYRVSRNPKFRDVSYKEVGRKQNLDCFYISLVPIMENLLEYLMLFSLLFCLTKRFC